MPIRCHDPSLTNTGIAILQDGRPAALHSIGFGGRDGANYDQRSQRIVAQCRAVTNWLLNASNEVGKVDIAVIEGPAYGHNLPSNHDRAGLWWGLYSAPPCGSSAWGIRSRVIGGRA